MHIQVIEGESTCDHVTVCASEHQDQGMVAAKHLKIHLIVYKMVYQKKIYAHTCILYFKRTSIYIYK